jgi:LEA14-like dessication related protein
VKYIFFFIISYNLLSCKISEPTFKNIGQWQISKINATEVTVSTTAYFYNPNTVDGIKLTGINLAVQTDGKNLGKLEINESIMTIPRLSDFQIPISFVINF